MFQKALNLFLMYFNQFLPTYTIRKIPNLSNSNK